MSDFALVRGNDATFSTTVDASLVGATIVFTATNGTQGLSKVPPTGIVVTDAAAGTLKIYLVPSDTVAWPIDTAPLSWALDVTLGSGKKYTVDSGTISVTQPLSPCVVSPAYASPADMAGILSPKLLAQLSAPSGDIPDGTVIQLCLDLAAAELNARIQQQYVVPVTGPASALAQLKRFNSIGAAWFLFEHRGVSDSDQAAAAAFKSWERVLKFADKIADQTYILPGASTPMASTSPTVVIGSDDEGLEWGGGCSRYA